MTRDEKRQLVEQLSAEFKDAPYAILVDYRGLTVGQVTDLRNKVRETNSNYRVVKNTLAKIAVPGTHLEGLKDYFAGPLAITTNCEEPVALCKVLTDFAKTNPKLEIMVGVVDGHVVNPEQVKELSQMPSREELLGKLLYVMKYPIQGFATALNGVIRNLAVVLNQVAESK